MSVKITKLTAPNVDALKVMSTFFITFPGEINLTATTATFKVERAEEALNMVTMMQEKAATEYGKRGGAYQSLHAVRRKVEVLVTAEREAEEFAHAESAKVEALRDSGALTDGLAAAKARSQARAEADAANDPLVALLGTDPRTGLAYGAAIRPKGWVTAHITEPVAEAAGVEAFRRYREARPGSTVPGRLRPVSKCGQRRPRRGRR